jgi:hypothetical protein
MRLFHFQCGLDSIQETMSISLQTMKGQWPLPLHTKKYTIKYFKDGIDGDSHTIKFVLEDNLNSFFNC